jgi:hypothetical protein
MRKLIAPALVLIGALFSDAQALDLTPHETTVTNDGPPVKRYFFQDGNKRLSFRIDKKMTVIGASDSAAFRFNDIRNAGMKLSKSQSNPQVPFDQKNLEPYRSAARSFVPANATDVQFEEEKPNAIAINGWVSQQFILNYKLFGFPYRCSVTFLNYSEKEQIVLDVRAPAADYEKTYLRGYRMLNSLSDLPAATTSGPT